MPYDSSVLAMYPKGPGYEVSSVCSLLCLLLNISPQEFHATEQ